MDIISINQSISLSAWKVKKKQILQSLSACESLLLWQKKKNKGRKKVEKEKKERKEKREEEKEQNED